MTEQLIHYIILYYKDEVLNIKTILHEKPSQSKYVSMNKNKYCCDV